MRYNLDSELPINAFSPRGGCGPFARGMTLEGGGGGFIGKAIGSVVGGITNAVKGIVQPVYNATLKNIPGVDSALVNLDKSVGKAIPGGWGTIATTAAAFIPGMQPLTMAGLGALNGSGVMRGNHQFNLQGAIMGGALAYGTSSLAQGLPAAGGGSSATDQLVAENIASNLGVEAASSGVGSQAAMLASQNAGFGQAGIDSINAGANQAIQSAQAAGATAPGTTNFAYNAAGEMVPSNVSADITGATAPNTVVPQPTGLQSLANSAGDYAKGTLQNISDAGTGIQNLSGLGTGADAASKAFSATGASLTNTALPIIAGGAGLASVEEQQKYLDQLAASGAISQAEYNTAKAKIDDQVAIANKTMTEHPFFKYASGGQVSENPPDDQTGMPNRAPMSNLEQGGLAALASNMSQQSFADGGSVNTQKTLEDYLAEYPIGGTFSPNNPNFTLDPNAVKAIDTSNIKVVIPPPPRSETETLYAKAKSPKETLYAQGGIASGRFLSGGGDGMSDSIHANINGSQEARLADGEFVIPADVVSHIGNGSSKAGAKQLYSMMDRVRQARVGTKKQGKQINPRKYLAG